MYNKCRALESSPKPFPLPESLEKLSSMKPLPGAKNIGNCCLKRYTEAPCQRLELSQSVNVTLFGNRVFYFYNLKKFYCIFIELDILQLQKYFTNTTGKKSI